MNNRLWIDVETTGFSSSKNRIVELAAIYQDGKGSEDVFHRYIKHDEYPDDYEKVVEVHGLTPEILEEKGEEEGNVFREFVCFAERVAGVDKLIMSGYNVPFDMRFIRETINRYDNEEYNLLFGDGNYCVYRRCKEWSKANVIPVLDNLKLKTVAEYFKVELKAHSALDDIRATIQIDKGIDELNKKKRD